MEATVGELQRTKSGEETRNWNHRETKKTKKHPDGPSVNLKTQMMPCQVFFFLFIHPASPLVILCNSIQDIWDGFVETLILSSIKNKNM